jgi:LacI family transcriptional regulator
MATMRDVAAAAGVSLKTVSRVVNGEPGVRGDTSERVQAAITALQFHPSAVARSLRIGHSQPLLGLVIGDLANPFYSGIARGVVEIAARKGFLVVTGSSEEHARSEDDLVVALCRQHIAGLLVVPAVDRAGPGIEARIPRVYLDRPAPDRLSDCVLLDNRGGANQGVSFLVMQGHRRIGVVGDDLTLYTASERLAGYRSAFETVGIACDESLIKVGAWTVSRAEACAHQLLEMARPPSAVFAMNNRACVGVLRAVTARKAQVAVLGFDELELADMIPAVDALIVHDPVEMGRVGARLLLARLAGDGGPQQTVVLPTKLVVY